MGTIVGVLVGYVVGARDGEEGLAEIKQAWKTIAGSEEVRSLLSGGFLLLRAVLGRLFEPTGPAPGSTDDQPRLRRIA